jgi:hypothetical protein
VQVKERLKFNRYQHKVNLPTEDLVHHDVGIFTGWGLTVYPSDTLPDQLQQVALRIFDNDYCSRWLPFTLHPEQVCGYNNVGIGGCSVSLYLFFFFNYSLIILFNCLKFMVILILCLILLRPYEWIYNKHCVCKL